MAISNATTIAGRGSRRASAGATSADTTWAALNSASSPPARAADQPSSV